MSNTSNSNDPLRDSINDKLNTITGKPESMSEPIDPLRQSMESAVQNIDMAPTALGKYGVGESSYDTGILPSQVDDLQRLRNEKQSGAQMLANASARVLPKIALGIVEQAGHLLDFEAHYKTLTGEGGDYSNILTDLAQSGTQALDETFPVNRRNDEVFDLGDAAWWISNGEGLVKSIGEFAVTGAGVGTVLAKGTGAMAKALMKAPAFVKRYKTAEGIAKGTAAIAKGANVTAQTGTAASLAYVEGTMGGAEVYKDVYAKAMSKYNDPAKAKEVAGKAAATAVRMNTVVNSALNFTSAGALMRNLKSTKRMNKALLKGSDDMPTWQKRLKGLELKDADNTSPLLQTTLSEMGQESLEELVNEAATAAGTFQGEDTLGISKSKSMGEAIVKALGTEEAALSGILGAVGGGGQHMATSLRKTGKANKEQEETIFNKQKEFLIKNIDEYQRNQENLKNASRDKGSTQYLEAQENLFNNSLFNSFLNGGQEHMSSIYEEIANMPTDQAEELGYDTDVESDNYYKKRAQDKVKEIKTLSDDFENIQASYNEFDEEAASSFYAENVFGMHLQKRKLRNLIELNQARLEKETADVAREQGARGTDITVVDINNYTSDIAAINTAIKGIDEEIAALKNAPATDFSLDPSNMGKRTGGKKSKKKRKLDREKQNRSTEQQEYNETLKRPNPNTVSGKQVLQDVYGMPLDKDNITQHSIKNLEAQKKALETKSKAITIKSEKRFAEYLKEEGNTQETFKSAVLANDPLVVIKSAIEKNRAHLEQLDLQYELLTSDEGRAKHISNAKKEQTKRNKEGADRAKAIEDEKESTKEKEVRATIMEKAKKAAEPITKTVTKAVNKVTPSKKKDTKTEPKADKVEPKKTKEDPLAFFDDPGYDPKDTSTEDMESIRAEETEKLEAAETEEEKQKIKAEYKAKKDAVLEGVADGVDAQGDPIKNVFTDAEKSTIKSEQSNKDSDKFEDGEVVNIESKSKKKEIQSTKEEDKGVTVIKTIEAGNAFAYASTDYKADETGVKKAVSNEKQKNLVKELESVKEFQPGDKITLEVDTSATWIDRNGNTRKYEDFVTDGVEDVGNVPIAIKKDGEIVAYVPTQDRLNEDDGYANIFTSDNPKNEHFENNKKQIALNKEIREKIVKERKVETVIQKKFSGSLRIDVNKGKKDYKPKTVRENMPKLETFAIVKNGKLHINKYEAFNGEIINGEAFEESLSEGKLNGTVFTMVPTPNGKFMATYVDTPSANQEQVDTIFNSVKAFLESNDDVRLGVQEFTDINISTADGLLAFLNRSVYTSKMGTKALQEKVDREDLSNNNKYLNLLSKNQGQEIILQFATQGGDINTIKTLEDLLNNEAAFRAFLSTKLIAVKLSELNDTNEYLDVSINNEGEAKEKELSSYNEHLKDNLKTDVVASEINEDEDNYFDHPGITFDTAFLTSVPSDNTETASIPKSEGTKEESEELSDAEKELLEQAGDLFDFSLDLNNESDSLDVEASNNIDRSSDDAGRAEEFKVLMKDDIQGMLVFDNETEVFYNSYLQEEVVDSIIHLMAKSMQTKPDMSAADSLTSALAQFERREQMLEILESRFNSKDELVTNLKRGLGVETLDEAQELVDQYKKVLRNWDQFAKFSKVKMANIFGIKETIDDSKDPQSIDEILEGYDNIDSMLEKANFDDGATFQTNHKDTASARFKLFLALQTMPGRNLLGLSKFMPFDTVYDELQTALAGSEPTYESMIERLHIAKVTKPYMGTLADTIGDAGKTSNQVRNEFVVAFSKQYNPFVTVIWNIDKRTGGYVLDPISTNRNDAAQRVEAEWFENQKKSPIVKEVKGSLVIDSGKAKEFEAKVDELKETLDVKGTQELLESIGITMPIEAIEHFKENSDRLTGRSFQNHFVEGVFRHLSTALNSDNKAEGTEDSLLELNNPLVGANKEGTSIKTLAKLKVQFDSLAHSSSHKDSENKTIYSYSLNSNLSHQFRRLLEDNGTNKTIDGLLGTSYAKDSIWANQIKNNKKFRDTFKLTYLDGLKKRYSSQKGVKRKNQSDSEMLVQTLALFQNRNQGEDGVEGNKTSHFVYPSISDKTTTPVITSLRHNSSIIMNGNDFTLGRKTKNALNAIVQSEIDRIESYVDPADKRDRIKGYDSTKGKVGALLFYHFPFLNDIVTPKLQDGKYKIPQEKREEMFKAVHDYVLKTSKNTFKQFEESGIVNMDEKSKKVTLKMDSSYLAGLRAKVGNISQLQLALYAAIDLEVNYMIANANILQLVSGDPAMHFKNDVETTMTVVQKRLAKDIAPGLDGNFEKKVYNNIFLNDKETDSIHLEEYKEILDNNADKVGTYQRIEGSDAQEYTTAQEHLDVMKAYGKLSDTEYTDLLDKANKGTLNKEELKKVLQPMKPVYVHTEVDNQRKLNKVTYIKSSSFPLLKQLTQDLEIDKLRAAMEDGDADIQRACYISASKLGATRMVDLWDGHHVSDKFDLTGKAVQLQRDGFRIQQEVPYKEDKTKVLTVSQMNKLLFEGIEHIPGMSELKERKEAIRKRLFDMGKEELLDKIGVKEGKDRFGNSTYEYTDLKKLQKSLEREAKSRNFPINDIKGLELTGNKKEFKIPISFLSSSDKFESLMTSMVTNTILKQKMPGKSYVQGSSAGFITSKTKSKKWSEMSMSNKQGITWVGDVDMDKGLQFVRGKDKVKGAQLIVPFYFRDAEGNTLNIKDYTYTKDKKTYIDESKMDKSLLKLIGARIPNQGHSSMLPIEIVGFLPRQMGDLVIVPDDITAQMGSDFDVDKLTTYNYNYYVKDGKLVKGSEENEEKKALQNEYIDIHWKVLTHPEVLPRVLSPLDVKGEYSLEKEADLINDIRTSGKETPSMLSRQYQQDTFIQNRAGKLGVGVLSLASTFNATIQGLDVRHSTTFKGKETPLYINVGAYKLHRLSGVGLNSKGPKSQVIADIQNAAVDNANEQRLDKLNLNGNTFGAAAALAQLEDKNGKNVDIKYITRLMSQKVIIDYVKEMESLNDSTIDQFVADKKQEAFDRLSDKYNKMAEGYVQSRKEDADMSVLTPDFLLEMIKDEDKEGAKWATNQLKVLQVFKKLNKLGETLTAVQSMINADSKGAPKDLVEAIDKGNKIAFRGSLAVVGIDPLFNPKSEIGTAVDAGVYLTQDLFGKFFPNIESLVTEYANITGKLEVSLDNQKKIRTARNGFLTTIKGIFEEGDIDVIRHRLLINSKESPSLAARVNEAFKTWGASNFLLQRIKTVSADVKGEPDVVQYVASIGARMDEQNAIKGIVDMLISDNLEQRELGKDLITYSYLTATSQGATNFLKFVPTSYLNSIGFGEAVKRARIEAAGENVNFMNQYVQHNPTITPEAHPDAKGKSFTYPAVSDDSTSKYLTGGYSNYFISQRDVLGGESIEYPKFVHIRGENNEEPKLYKGAPNDMGDMVYTQISTAGGSKQVQFTEYDYQKEMVTPIIESKRANTKSKLVSIPSPSKDQQYPNKQANTNILAAYGLKDGDGKDGIANALNYVKDNSTFKANKAIADMLLSKMDSLPDLTFRNKKLSGSGALTPQGIKGGKKAMLSIDMTRMPNTSKFEDTLLHETLHAYTSHIINEYVDGNMSALTEMQKKTVKSLDVLRNKVIKGLNETEAKEYKQFVESYEKFRAAKISKDSKKTQQALSEMSTYAYNKYYGLYNVNEFVTMTMTNDGFQKMLSGIEFTGKKTVLDRFKDIVAKLFTTLKEKLGIKYDIEGTVLAEAIKNTAILVDNTGYLNSNESQDLSGMPIDALPKGVDPFADDSLDANEYASSRPLTLDRVFRSKYKLLNSSGGNKQLSYKQAFNKAKELNTDDKFKREYGLKYKATYTKIPKEKGDKRKGDVYNLKLVPRVTTREDFSLDVEENNSTKDLIKRLEAKLKSYKNSMSENRGDSAVYENKIHTLEGQIEMLNNDNNLKTMKAISKAHMSWVSNTLDAATISSAEINDAYDTLSIWANAKDIFRDEYNQGGKFKTTIKDITSDAEDLIDRVKEASADIAKAEANKELSRNVSDMHLNTIKDISIGTALVLDLSSVDNPFIQALDNRLKRSIRDTNVDFSRESDAMDKIIKAFEQTAEFKANGYNKFLQKDKNGDWTGGLVVEYAQMYYDVKASIRKKAKDNKNYREYFKWSKENEIIINPAILFNESGILVDTKQAKSHIKMLEAEFGVEKANDLIEEATTRYLKYLEDKEAIMLSYENRKLNPDYSDKDYDRDVLKWSVANNPKSIPGAIDLDPKVTVTGWKYVVMAPRKTFTDSKGNKKATRWYDNNFKEIQENPELKEFYDFYKGKLDVYMDNLPKHQLPFMKNNFLPMIKNDLLESYSKNGLKGALRNISEGLVGELTSSSTANVSDDRDGFTGKVNQRIPISFIEGDLKPGERSNDLGKLLQSFAMTSLNYKHKSKAEESVLLMQRLINDAVEQKMNANGGKAYDSKGNLYQVKDGLVNLKRAADHAIKASIYGDKREDGQNTGLMMAKNIKDSAKATRINKQISRLNSDLENGYIGEVEHAEAVAPLEEQLKEMKARNVTTVDLADTFMKITQLKGMAYNVFASTNNISFGLISNMIQAAGGEDFTIKQAMQAYKIMLNSTAKSAGFANDTSRKVAALMDKFDVLFEVDETAYNGGPKKEKAGLAKFTPYEMQRRSEFFVQGQLMVASMLKKTATKIDGTETSLFEAFDSEGNWKVDEYGDNKGWNGDINKEGDLSDFKQFQNYIIELNKVVHGNYDPASFPLMKRYLLGRAGLQFKSWLAESVKRRFAGETYNEALGRKTKGYYRTGAQNMGTLFKMAMMNKGALTSLSTVDQANMKKMMAELVFTIGIMAAGLLVKAIGDDDENKPVTNIMLNQLYRLESDMTFFLSPSSANRILSNPFPMINTYMKAEKALVTTGNYILEGTGAVEVTDNRSDTDEERLLRDWSKVFPMVNIPSKMETQIGKVINY